MDIKRSSRKELLSVELLYVHNVNVHKVGREKEK